MASPTTTKTLKDLNSYILTTLDFEKLVSCDSRIRDILHGIYTGIPPSGEISGSFKLLFKWWSRMQSEIPLLRSPDILLTGEYDLLCAAQIVLPPN